MQLELTFTNEARHVSCVDAFIVATLAQLPLDDAVSASLSKGLASVTKDAIHHAYSEGESGLITLSVREDRGRLEIRIRDYGIPRDVEAMERELHEGHATHPHSHLDMLLESHCVDEIHWLNFGPEGKALQLLKWLQTDHIAGSEEGNAAPSSDLKELAPDQAYEVRRMHADEAEQVAQLMYRVYGNSYFNEDVYYPSRIAAQHEHGLTVSYVAATEAGKVVGHYALERLPESRIAEVGQAVVDPRHRRRGLLDRMKKCALEDASHSDLAGWFADAVTVHTYTQQSNVTTHGCLTAANLGIAPSKEQFDTGREQTQRVTCLLYFHWLIEPSPRTVYVPRKHQSMVSEIYSRLGCDVAFGDGDKPVGAGGILSTSIIARAGRANLMVNEIGADTIQRVQQARRNLVEQSHLEVLFLDLPLADPSCAYLAEAVERQGFGFLGVVPEMFASGDAIRFAYLVDALQREPIKTVDETAESLVEYALGEQSRLRESLG